MKEWIIETLSVHNEWCPWALFMTSPGMGQLPVRKYGDAICQSLEECIRIYNSEHRELVYFKGIYRFHNLITRETIPVEVLGL